ncbi:MAG: hypothetical protein IT186_22060 [Acidobacteria bacterium]|nr:hypothetical protein [Acidobacteriota bacterium]
MNVSVVSVLIAAAALFSPVRAESAEHVVFIPAAAHAPGLRGTMWSTDLTLWNPSPDRPVRLEVTFFESGVPGNQTAKTVDLQAAHGTTIPDVAGSFLGATGSGALRVRGEGPFRATSRTSTPSPSGGRYGVAVPAVPDTKAVSNGYLLLSGTSGTGSRRMTLGAFNPGQAAAAVEISIRDLDGRLPERSERLDLPPFGHVQLNDVSPGILQGSGAVVSFDAKRDADVCGCPSAGCCRLPAPVFVFATEIDNETGDGSFVLAEATDGPSEGAVALQRFVMPLHACEPGASDCRDPRNHRVLLGQSEDGRSFTPVPGFISYRGSVPDAVRRGNTLYLYTPGELTRFHLDTGKLDPPVAVSLQGDQGGAGFVDPSPVLDENGRITLFYLPGILGGDPAGCPSGAASCVKQIASATEVEGSDGQTFSLDTGARLEVTVGTSENYRTASDPDVFFDGNSWVVYVSHGASLSVWTSSVLRGTYIKTGDLTAGTGGVGSGHFDETAGRYWTYAHVTKAGKSVIRRAVHPSLTARLAESDFETVVTAESLGLPASWDVYSPGFTIGAFP